MKALSFLDIHHTRWSSYKSQQLQIRHSMVSELVRFLLSVLWPPPLQPKTPSYCSRIIWHGLFQERTVPSPREITLQRMSAVKINQAMDCSMILSKDSMDHPSTIALSFINAGLSSHAWQKEPLGNELLVPLRGIDISLICPNGWNQNCHADSSHVTGIQSYLLRRQLIYTACVLW